MRRVQDPEGANDFQTDLLCIGSDLISLATELSHGPLESSGPLARSMLRLGDVAAI